MPGHRKTAAATRLTANRSLSAPPARVSITKRNRNSSRTARTRPRRGLHDVTASQSLHAAIPQKRLITERQCPRAPVELCGHAESLGIQALKRPALAVELTANIRIGQLNPVGCELAVHEYIAVTGKTACAQIGENAIGAIKLGLDPRIVKLNCPGSCEPAVQVNSAITD